MRTPHLFLAYAPRGAGLRCALAYFASERDVYGWFTGPRADASIASCFFLAEDFYTNRPSRYAAVEQPELHSAWPLGETRRHELARMQEAVAREWLFYRDDTRAAAELQAYAAAELAAGDVNVRFERLARFSTLQPNWTAALRAAGAQAPREALAARVFLRRGTSCESLNDPAPSRNPAGLRAHAHPRTAERLLLAADGRRPRIRPFRHADWIDPETGAPAEEERPRIEEH
jgi:hypothetical protein